MFTSKDVARAAGVSQSTVSYVMSGKRPISEETRKRVLAAIEQLTYEPNAGARALAGRRTHVVGLVVPFAPGADTAGLLPFIETIAACVREHDYDVLLVTADEGSAGLRRLAGRRLCDAIVLMDLLREDDRLPVAAALDLPVILIGVPSTTYGLPCVDVDFAEMARLAVDELVATGHEKLALIGYSQDAVGRDLNFVRRFQDAARAAARRRRVPLEIVSPVEPDRAGVQAALARVLPTDRRRRVPRTGLVVPHSQAVRPLLAALAERGLTPGRDVSVIGVTTDVAAQEMQPALTNVSLEPRDVSRRAMDLLFRLLDSPPARTPAVELVAPRLTRRDTVMPAPHGPVPRARPARAGRAVA